MNEKDIRQALEAIAHQNVPDETDLWMRIYTQTQKKDVSMMRPRIYRPLWTFLLVLLGLLMISGVAYALYHLFNDAGLQAVDEAGLAATMQVDAIPTLLPAITPLPDPGQATLLSESQTIDGVTLTLDWIYLESMQLSLGATLNGLPPDTTVGLPRFDFNPMKVQQTCGEILVVSPDAQDTEQIHLLYHANQVLSGSLTDGELPLSIELPLVSVSGEADSSLPLFHFPLHSIPFYRGQHQGFYDCEVRSNQTIIRLESLYISPESTQARLCFSPPDENTGWSLNSVYLQYSPDATPGTSQNKVIQSDRFIPLAEDNGLLCTRAIFPDGAKAQDRSLRLEVNGLHAPDGTSVNGLWRFQASLPDIQDIPGIAVPSPTPEATLLSQMAGGMRATLDWAYADAARAAFEFRFEGWQEDMLVSSTNVHDAQGNLLGIGYIQSINKESGIAVMIFQPNDPAYLQQDEISIQFDLPVFRVEDPAGLPPQQPLASFHFEVSLPVYPALELQPGLQDSAHEISMQFVSLKASPSYTEASLCFQKPSDGIPSDWIISQSARLVVGDRESSIDSYSLLYDPDYGLNNTSSLPGFNATPGWRCVRVGFALGHHNQSAVMKISIAALEQAPLDFPADRLQAARRQLEEEGISIELQSVSSSGGGGGGWVVERKPEEMDDQQAIQRLFEIMGYSYSGPWIFEIEVNP